MSGRSRRRAALGLGLPPVLLLLGFFVLPYVDMVGMSLRPAAAGAPYGAGFTLAQYGRVLGDPYYLGAIGRSVATGLLVTVLCLALAYPLALHLARTRGRRHALVYAAVVSPLLIGVLVRNFGWMILLAVDGPINRALVAAGLASRPLRFLFTEGVVVLALVHVFVPFLALPIAGALRAQDPALRDASRSLGAGAFETFWRVTLPLSFPGIQAGVTLVFVLSVAAYVTPALLGGQGLGLAPSIIVQQLTGSFAWPFGAALAVTTAAATLCLVAAFAVATRRLAERTRP